MKLTIFQSDKGDCLLLTGRDGKRVLVDGGMADSYTEHVASALGQLAAQNKKLDVVYVSHIDQDHISGVLRMMEDLVDWRVHDHQKKTGHPSPKRPESVRPPEVRAIWHNAFHELVGDNAGPIADMFAASAAILSGGDDARMLELADAHQELATSVGEAIQLSRRIGHKQLGIPLNKEFDGKLICLRSGMPATLRIGRMIFHILGPFEQDLDNLLKEWNAWLQAKKDQLKRIQTRAKIDEERLTAGAEQIMALTAGQARDLAAAVSLEAAQAKKLGRRKMVTAPNLASLMFLVEEHGKTLLLTGDGHHEDILKGLQHHGKLEAHGGMHADVLKVQHHGSEHNIDLPFCKAVTADHYVFCGNGEHENPDRAVVETIINSRIGKSEDLSRNPQVGKPFELWFNCDESETPKEAAKEHMRALRALVEERANKSGGRLTFTFLSDSSMALPI